MSTLKYFNRMVLDEFEWPPSTSFFEADNVTAEYIRNFCTVWIKNIEAEGVIPESAHRLRPSNFIIWVVGLSCVTLISLCAAVGILFVKRLSRRTYNHFITIFVALGVGSLITSSTLHLLPQGLGVADGENYEFIVVMMFCVFGIYTFFFCDKFIKITLESKKMNEIEMSNISGVPSTEIGAHLILSTDTLISENGHLKRDNFPTAKIWEKEGSYGNQSRVDDSILCSGLDMSRQVPRTAHGSGFLPSIFDIFFGWKFLVVWAVIRTVT